MNAASYRGVRLVGERTAEHCMEAGELSSYLATVPADTQVELTIDNGHREPLTRLEVKTNGHLTWIELGNE